MILPIRPYVVPAPRPCGDDTSWSDVWLLVLVLVTHAIPLVALAAGSAWGRGLQGYATAVVLVSGRELVRDVRRNLRTRALARSRA